MRIVFITREGYQSAGARIRCYNFAGQLRRYGCDADVLSFTDNLGALDGDDEFLMSWRQKAYCNILAFKRLVKESRNTVFFIQRLNYHALAPVFVSCLKGQKIIFDCDDWNIREDPRYYFGVWPSSKMEFFVKRLASYAHTCIVASGYLEDFLKPFARRIFFLPTGVDTGLFRPDRDLRRDGKHVVLGWLGTVYHEDMYENLMFLLDCFSELICIYPDLTLKIAGKGRYFDKFRAEVSRHPNRGSIRLDGWVAPEDVPAYLGGVDIGLLPLVRRSKFNLSKSPTKLFEYMACAKPVLASNVGEAARIIKDGRNGLLAGSKRDFIQKLLVLILDPGLRKSMGDCARRDAQEQYSLDILGKSLFEIARVM